MRSDGRAKVNTKRIDNIFGADAGCFRTGDVITLKLEFEEPATEGELEDGYGCVDRPRKGQQKDVQLSVMRETGGVKREWHTLWQQVQFPLKIEILARKNCSLRLL